MSELDPQIKMGLEIVGLPTSIEDAKIWIEDPDNLKTAQSLLEKVPEDIKSKIPQEMMQILNNPSPEKKSSDTTGDIGAPELNADNKANIKKIFQDIEKSIYNSVIMDKTDVKNNVENVFLFKTTPANGKNKRPDIHNIEFYHETQTQSDIPIFDTTAFWEPFIKDMFYPPGESSNTMDDFFLDIIDRVVQKINLSLKDQPYRVIYYKTNEIPDSLQGNFKENTNNIALKSIPNEQDIKKILEEKLKESVKDI
tara:strand:+ start:52 stop:810 length:759 start_codon:yes stop_codon:yes gene_type:complete